MKNGEQRSGGVKNGSDSRVNRLFTPGDEEDGNCQAGGAQDGKDPPGLPVPWPFHFLVDANRNCCDGTE